MYDVLLNSNQVHTRKNKDSEEGKVRMMFERMDEELNLYKIYAASEDLEKEELRGRLLDNLRWGTEGRLKAVGQKSMKEGSSSQVKPASCGSFELKSRVPGRGKGGA